ncbi:hypothetical protein JY651_39800 [Pyxidicoccus parkwayensis]|uniref:DUF4276 family protein n=1 Tax=Pyxidicoccus parkwayensis TaxID=2813578 RepID=A0ABX7NRE6_9BACT|nr:hypothetical protein [Pyxidicoccus parkwaysis]QSQ21273.1 hypothetical protein JY651_39800 [Pyxidicoccus parkwaysis]
MKLYLLVEGEQTEKRLFRAWLGHCFPQLSEVQTPADLAADTFFLLAGMGYPSYLQRIPQALEDAAQHHVDHLFICIDSEDRTYEQRRSEVAGILEAAATALQRRGLQFLGRIHVIVADCCVESWLLGHRRLVPRQPTAEDLLRFKQFYDVSLDDPERMGCPTHAMSRALYHHDYLRAVFRHHGQTYLKNNPGIAREGNYLAALRDRCLDEARPPHLQSFRVLWDVWSEMGGRFEDEESSTT